MKRLASAWRRRRWQPDPVALAAYAGLKPVVVVTGASDGIGLALARRFARAGHDVLLVARGAEALDAAAAGIRSAFAVEAATLAADVSSPDAPREIDDALRGLGAYADVLVNSAGMGLAGPFAAQPAEELGRLVDVNVRAVTTLSRHYLTGMRERGRGGILNLASLGGYVPGPYQAAYYASKAYVISLSEALAFETAGEGVRVCAVAPGPVRTSFHRRMNGDSAFYLQVLPVSSPDSVARLAYLGFTLGWRVVVPGLAAPVLALAMKLSPHRISVPIVGWLLKPRRTGEPDAGR